MIGKWKREAMKALQEFLKKEHRMPFRILAAQTISKIRTGHPLSTEGFKKSNIFQWPGAEKVKRVEIVDVSCPHCHTRGTASQAGFEHEFACEGCEKMVQREVPENCIEKRPVGSVCVGKERYQKYLKGRITRDGIAEHPASSKKFLNLSVILPIIRWCFRATTTDVHPSQNT